jgi:hypothetical protein
MTSQASADEFAAYVTSQAAQAQRAGQYLGAVTAIRQDMLVSVQVPPAALETRAGVAGRRSAPLSRPADYPDRATLSGTGTMAAMPVTLAELRGFQSVYYRGESFTATPAQCQKWLYDQARAAFEAGDDTALAEMEAAVTPEVEKLLDRAGAPRQEDPPGPVRWPTLVAAGIGLILAGVLLAVLVAAGLSHLVA